MLPDGSCIQKNRGIPSGSQFTQLIGSICNMLIVRYLISTRDIMINQERYLGDDSLILINNVALSRLRFNSLVYEAEKLFNMEINRSKIRITEKTGDIKFLGYECQGYVLQREYDRWFRSAIFPESRIRNR